MAMCYLVLHIMTYCGHHNKRRPIDWILVFLTGWLIWVDPVQGSAITFKFGQDLIHIACLFFSNDRSGSRVGETLENTYCNNGDLLSLRNLHWSVLVWAILAKPQEPWDADLHYGIPDGHWGPVVPKVRKGGVYIILIIYVAIFGFIEYLVTTFLHITG